MSTTVTTMSAPVAETASDGPTAAGKENSPETPDSKADAEISIDFSRESRRESLRARLRASEEKLLGLVRTPSNDGGVVLMSKVASAQSDLRRVEQQKSELEKELERLKTATDGDNFLAEKMKEIQEGFDKQVKKIEQLNDQVFKSNNEIELLRNELVNKLRRIIELEFDLETHDVHYTDYAKEQYQLGEEAIAEIKAGKEREKKGGDDDLEVMKPKKALVLISKLLADLDSLEVRYKDEKLESSTKLDKLQQENEELKTHLFLYKHRVGEESELCDDEMSQGAIEYNDNIFILRRRVETLEAKRLMYRREIDRLKSTMSDMEEDHENGVNNLRQEIERLCLENDAMKSRVEELEAKKKLFRKKKESGEEYQAVEERIRTLYNNTERLQASNQVKDRQIATLKKEVATLRMRQIASGDTKSETYSKFDTELLNTPTISSGRTGAEDESGLSVGADSPQIARLQRQLQDAQQALVKKDQELVIERAKAASTAAGLLARITELTGRKAEMRVSKSGSMRSPH